jgi:hypothetical protein
LFRVLSDNVLQTGFKYVVTIRNVRTNTIIATTYYMPDPDPGQYIEFDVSRFLEGQFDYLDGLNTKVNGAEYFKTGFYRSTGCILPFSVQIDEFWDSDADGILNVVSGNFVSENYNAVPFSFSPYDAPYFNTQATVNYTEPRPWTDFKEITLSEFSFYNFLLIDPITFFNFGLYGIIGVEIKTFNASGQQVATIFIPHNIAVNASLKNFITYLHVRADSFTSTTSLVELRLKYDGVTTGETLFARIKIKRCHKQTPRVLFFLNNYGGFDSFYFSANNFTSKQVERKTYKRYVNNYGYIFEQDKVPRYRNSSPSYHTRVKTMMQLQSDWITDEDSRALEQLFTSPMVYLLDNGDKRKRTTDQLFDNYDAGMIKKTPTLIPVIVKDTMYDIKYSRSHKNFQYTINIEFAEEQIRQTT